MPGFKALAALALAAAPGAHAAPRPITPAASIECLSYATAPTSVTTTPNLASPQDIAVDGIGDIFVIDSLRAELIRIDATTHESAILLGRPKLEIPIGLTISPTHADLYIGDENSSTLWHFKCQTQNNNACPQYYPNPINISLGTQVHPVGLQLDGDDHLYIADFNGHRVLKRDSLTAKVSVLMAGGSNGIPANFGPHDIAVDRETHQVLVTDVTNDDIWALKCAQMSKTGYSCDQYVPAPFKLPLTGTSANIEKPSGIVVDLQSTIYVTGMKNGIVAEIKANNSVDLLQYNTGSSLQDPVSLGYDERGSAKTLYISDDPTGASDNHQGLWKLPCTQLACVGLSEKFIQNVRSGECKNTPIGHSCTFQCKPGTSSPNATSVTCTTDGWASQNIMCLSDTPSGSATTVAPPDSDGVAAAVGVSLAMLVIGAAATFLFIRSRKAAIRAQTSDYTPFGSVKLN